MTVLFLKLCYNEVYYKGIKLYFSYNHESIWPLHMYESLVLIAYVSSLDSEILLKYAVSFPTHTQEVWSQINIQDKILGIYSH